MVDFLNDDIVYEGQVTVRGELITAGPHTIGAGGTYYGDSVGSPDAWPTQTRVQVADATERAAVAAWRAANSPISASNPLLVWRADGALGGVCELTIDGTNWLVESPLAGDVEMTLSATAPYGWLLMQGQLLANAATNYPALWASASTVLRSGSSLLIPDMRGRVPVGVGTGAGLTLRNLGDQFGAEAVAITLAQLATHSHSGTTGNSSVDATITSTDASSNPTGSANLDRGSTSEGGSRTIAGSNHTHPFTTNNAGEGAAHPNMQPSLALNFKVKV